MTKQYSRQIRIFGAGLLLLTVLILKHDPRNWTESDLFILPGQVILLVLSYTRIIAALKEAPYSLRLFHWFFVYFFWGIAPVTKLIGHQHDWLLHKTTEEAVLANAVLIVWCLFFLAGEKLAAGAASQPESIGEKSAEERITVTQHTTLEHEALYLAVAAILVTVIRLAAMGIPDPFSREDLVDGVLNPSSPLGQILYKGQAGLITIAFAMNLRYRRKISILLGILLLATCSPIYLSRFLTATIYLGLLLFLLAEWKMFRTWCAWLLTGALAIVYPLMECFRHKSLWDVNLWNLLRDILKNLQGVYQTEQFESWSMMAYTIRYTRLYGYSKGRQLLGTLLFWIPRRLWSDKPIGSGAMMFEEFHPGFINVSCPLPGELYLNFGIFGTAALGILAGWLLTQLDREYQSRKKLQFVYPFLVPLFFFILRGDMMSSIAYAVGFFALTIMVHLCWIISRLLRNRKGKERSDKKDVRDLLEKALQPLRGLKLRRLVMALVVIVTSTVCFYWFMFTVNIHTSLTEQGFDNKREEIQRESDRLDREMADAEQSMLEIDDHESEEYIETARKYWQFYNDRAIATYWQKELEAYAFEQHENRLITGNKNGIVLLWVLIGVFLGGGIYIYKKRGSALLR